MKIIILKPNGIGRYDDVSPFMIVGNGLDLTVKLPALSGEFYFIAENNGNKIKLQIPYDGSITLNGLSAGELSAQVRHFAKGELIKTYRIEPLLLKEIDGDLAAEPEIIALNREVEEMKQVIAEQHEKAEGLEERLKTVSQEYEERFGKLQLNTLALIKFAFTDYRENVYLGGGNFERFLEEFGLNLTEEEKKNLKGEQQ